jgi:hypothetical protein
MKQKVVLRDKKKILTEINGKFNDISSADEHKFKKIIRVFI